jgi:hypothetical protein
MVALFFTISLRSWNPGTFFLVEVMSSGPKIWSAQEISIILGLTARNWTSH